MRYSLFSIISFLFFLSLFDWIQSSGIWLVFHSLHFALGLAQAASTGSTN